jgi:hypothetical protein
MWDYTLASWSLLRNLFNALSILWYIPHQVMKPGGAAEAAAQSPSSQQEILAGVGCAIAGDLAIRRRLSRLNYSRRCAEASAVQVHIKQGFTLAPGMEIAYVVKDAKKWEMDPARTASEFDADYYRGLLEKAWVEAAFVFMWIRSR